MTLDFIKALLWPAVVVVGVFWLFRSEVRTLLGKAGRR
jgi:ATP/ADP translocase